MNYAKNLLRTALIIVIGQVTVACAPVQQAGYSHHPDAACTISCAKNFPRTGGHNRHP